MREVRIVANGKALATVANNDFIAVNLPVGANSIWLDVTDGKPLSFEMNIDREAKFYVAFTGGVTKTGQAMTSYNEFTVYLQWHLRAYPVNKSEAQVIVEGFGKRLE